MVERTDIDALLISALYGELTPAQESQLTAHLESHPADRTALDGLTRTRTALHQSRILEVQLEPPQSVSAMLLQEAARRAPKAATEGEGWFARFARSFMQHPAMAAAAMLVLVVGIAAVVSRNGGGFAEKTADDKAMPASETTVARGDSPAPAPTAAGSAAVDQAPADSFQVNLAEGGKQQLAQEQSEAMRDAQKVAVTPPRKKGGETGMALERERPMPKELEAAAPKAKFDRNADRDEAPPADPSSRGDADYRGDGLVAGNAGAVAPAKVAAPPPPPPPPPTTPKPTVKAEPPMSPPGGGATYAADDAKEETRNEKKTLAKDAAAADPSFAWAKDQHDRMKSLVKANDCAAAADIALAIADRSPAYYQQNVATDRSVKACNSYIAQKIEQRNEQRAQRERAKKANAEPTAPKRAVDEAKPATKAK